MRPSTTFGAPGPISGLLLPPPGPHHRPCYALHSHDEGREPPEPLPPLAVGRAKRTPLVSCAISPRETFQPSRRCRITRWIRSVLLFGMNLFSSLLLASLPRSGASPWASERERIAGLGGFGRAANKPARRPKLTGFCPAFACGLACPSAPCLTWVLGGPLMGGRSPYGFCP